jgi:hypothetical protein
VEAAVQEAKRLEGRLEGIILTAREMGHVLNNDLQIPFGTLEMLLDSDEMPADLRATANKAMSDLVAAKQHILQSASGNP